MSRKTIEKTFPRWEHRRFRQGKRRKRKGMMRDYLCSSVFSSGHLLTLVHGSLAALSYSSRSSPSSPFPRSMRPTRYASPSLSTSLDLRLDINSQRRSYSILKLFVSGAHWCSTGRCEGTHWQRDEYPRGETSLPQESRCWDWEEGPVNGSCPFPILHYAYPCLPPSHYIYSVFFVP